MVEKDEFTANELENDDSEPAIQEEEHLGLAEMKRRKKKLLLDFRCKVEDSILSHYLLENAKKENLTEQEVLGMEDELREISLWGVPLLPSRGHEGTDIVLLKFLRAKDFKVKDAFEMLQMTLKWRIENKINEIVDEDMGLEQQKGAFVDGTDRDGRPLCYCLLGNFFGRDMYKTTFESKEKREEFLRWRVKCMEIGVRKLGFKNVGADSIIQITDLKNETGRGMKEMQKVWKKILLMIQDNYPEVIHKHIMINVPFWFYALQAVHSSVLTQRNKNKFLLARPSKVTDTLLKFIPPEILPVVYGGLKRDNDEEFSPADRSSGLVVKGNSSGIIHLPVSEPGMTLHWDLTVIGWDVQYKEEFVPDDEGSYRVLLQKENRMGNSVRNSFYINEPGKMVITMDNATSKKKNIFYRTKIKPTVFPVHFVMKK